MKPIVRPLAALAAGLLFATAGCQFEIQHSGSSTTHHVSSPDSAVLAEIDAVGSLTFDNHRAGHLKEIAQRPTLAPEAQVHLVKATFKHLTFEHAKSDVLLALVENPGFANPAKETILKGLNNLTFENERRRVLNAISKRGELK